VIEAGERAPDVELWIGPRQQARLHDLTAPGEGMLLLFYLFDWSATCTNELLLLRDRRADLEEAGFAPFGVSRDSPWSHIAWREALDLDVPLLSDWNGDATHAFGIAHEYRGLKDVSERSAFLLDGDRIVRWTRCYEPGEVPDLDELVDAARGLVAA
jgi:peroxiredoxin